MRKTRRRFRKSQINDTSSVPGASPMLHLRVAVVRRHRSRTACTRSARSRTAHTTLREQLSPAPLSPDRADRCGSYARLSTRRIDRAIPRDVLSVPAVCSAVAGSTHGRNGSRRTCERRIARWSGRRGWRSTTGSDDRSSNRLVKSWRAGTLSRVGCELSPATKVELAMPHGCARRSDFRQ